MKDGVDTFTFTEAEDINKTLGTISKSKNKIAIFNKVSGVFIGLATVNTEPYLNDKLYKWKKIKIDELTQLYEGDYDTGSVVNTGDLPVKIKESDLDLNASRAIQAVHRWYHQMNLLTVVVHALIKKNNLSVKKIVTQSVFLQKMGIIYRANLLSEKMTFKEKANMFYRIERLLSQKKMGALFKVFFAQKKK